MVRSLVRWFVGSLVRWSLSFPFVSNQTRVWQQLVGCVGLCSNCIVVYTLSSLPPLVTIAHSSAIVHPNLQLKNTYRTIQSLKRSFNLRSFRFSSSSSRSSFGCGRDRDRDVLTLIDLLPFLRPIAFQCLVFFCSLSLSLSISLSIYLSISLSLYIYISLSVGSFDVFLFIDWACFCSFISFSFSWLAACCSCKPSFLFTCCYR